MAEASKDKEAPKEKKLSLEERVSDLERAVTGSLGIALRPIEDESEEK